MARNQEIDIVDPLCIELMKATNSKDLPELSQALGIPVTTLHGWNTGRRSPLAALTLAATLEKKTGKTVSQLLKRVLKDQE